MDDVIVVQEGHPTAYLPHERVPRLKVSPSDALRLCGEEFLKVHITPLRDDQQPINIYIVSYIKSHNMYT